VSACRVRKDGLGARENRRALGLDAVEGSGGRKAFQLAPVEEAVNAPADCRLMLELTVLSIAFRAIVVGLFIVSVPLMTATDPTSETLPPAEGLSRTVPPTTESSL